jgi:hypothetical protein
MELAAVLRQSWRPCHCVPGQYPSSCYLEPQQFGDWTVSVFRRNLLSYLRTGDTDRVQSPKRRVLQIEIRTVQLGYLDVAVQEKLRSAWPGPFVKVEGCCD